MIIKTPFVQLLLCAAALSTAGAAPAFEAGLRQISVPGASAGAAPTTVLLYYPTQAPARAIAMGPMKARVAMQGPPEAAVKGLILLSHGTGGSEFNHSTLAEALAQSGYLVAALRHPGDNWQDTSMLRERPARYFDERPRQASRVIDAVLADPDWKDRIARDERGPRVGAVGHSAGGYTVLALAGGEPDLARIAAHCTAERAQDPIFCGLAGSTAQAVSPATEPTLPLRDPRVRAVVALSPAGVVFSAPSLAGIKLPVALYVAQLDRFLVPRFHGEWVARHLPGVELHTVANAWHYAFQDAPSMAIQTVDGDLAADPPGFDRPAFLRQLGQELPAFFERSLR